MILDKIEKSKTNQIIFWCLTNFSLSWTVAFLLKLLAININSTVGTFCIAAFYMFGPLFATLVLKRIILKENINFKQNYFNLTFKKYLITIALFFVYIFLFMFTVFIIGNIFGFNSNGKLNFSFNHIIGSMNLLELKNLEKDSVASALPFIIFFIALLFISVFSGIINSIFTTFEEYGWRGFLFEELSFLGYLKSNIFIGIVWGIWHIPLIIQGLNFSNNPILGSFLMILACICLSFILSYLRIKTNSIFLVSVFHGMINAVGTFLLAFIESPNDLFCNLVGVYGIVAALILTLIILLAERKALISYGNSN